MLSPRNTEEEIREKMALYFDADAQEIWVCGTFGEICFYGPGCNPVNVSSLCPTFPRQIES